MMEKLSLFRTTKRILFGPGAVEKIGTEAQLLKAKKVLMITDPGIIQAGLLEGIEKSLQSVGIPFVIFDGVEPDPRIEVVEKSIEKAKKEGIDLIIGFGGGSSLDIAKVTSILITNSGKIDSFFGVDLVPQSRNTCDSYSNHSRHRKRSNPHRHLIRYKRKIEKRDRKPYPLSRSRHRRSQTYHRPSPFRDSLHRNGCLNPCH
jgi:hypothetical protein